METDNHIANKLSFDLIQTAIEECRIVMAVQGVHFVRDVDSLLYQECLARLIDRCGAIRGAGEFIPILDSKRRTPTLDKHMIKLVLDELQANRLAVLGCNLSADSLAPHGHWNEIYGQIVARSHLAERLVLEVTETNPLHDIQAANECFESLRKLGCRIAIDDFGGGMLTPLQLLKLEVDIVKIDAAFVYRIKKGPKESNSLKHIIGIAKCTAPIVVVEGVETEKHMFEVMMAGATHVQGFYLSRPSLLNDDVRSNYRYQPPEYITYEMKQTM